MKASNASDVVVLGGMVLDVVYKAHPPIKASDMAGQSSPSDLVRRSMGGVGRNIAEAMSRLGENTALISIVGDDATGGNLISECSAIGINCDAVVKSASGSTATYTALLGSDGELGAAAANMGVFDLLTPSLLMSSEAAVRLLRTCRCLILDANMRADTSLAAARFVRKENPTAIVTFEAVSAAKCVRGVPLLPFVDLVKANHFEAKAMCRVITKKDYDKVEECVKIVCRQSRRALFVCTRGSRGALLCSSKDLRLRSFPASPIDPAEIKKVTGAGDTMFACINHGLLRGLRIEEAIGLGLRGARLALLSTEAIPGDLATLSAKRSSKL